jgi:hypothetical protein
MKRNGETHHLTAYDGTRRLGTVAEADGRCVATAADGTDLGAFANRRAAIRALAAFDQMKLQPGDPQ